jgi:DNA-binding NarL/FixJ family response regulator
VSEIDDALRRIVAGGTVVDPEVIGKLLRRRRERSALDELDDQEPKILAMMAEGLSDEAIAERLSLPQSDVERALVGIFAKLGLEAGPSDHRRVLAVLTYLRE